MMESAAKDDWVIAALLADDDIAAIVGDRVYRDYAPQKADLPHIVTQGTPGVEPDENTANGTRAAVRSETDALAVSKSQAQSLVLAARIDAILHKCAGTSGTLAIYGQRTREILEPADLFAGASYYRAGGTYAFIITT